MNPDNGPTAVDLAREADFEAGPLLIRPSLRQVEMRGQMETMEPRVMQVLVALFQRRGEVVSRDELIERCWGGRIVGEDAISRCITRIRKLGEINGAYTLETIARVGYRLLLVETTAPPPSEAESQIEPTTPATLQPASSPRFAVPAFFRKNRIAVGTITAMAALFVFATILMTKAERPDTIDVDAVVAGLTQKLQQQAANPQGIAQVGAAVQQLEASVRPEERSAFASLAYGDNAHAIEVLEDLAADLEARGDRAAAAEVYTRIGAIALVVDQGRGLAARRKAILLSPESLPAFQGLFLDTGLLRGASDSEKLIEDALARPGTSIGMRAWVLAHRGLVETDWIGDDARANATRNEIEELHRETDDPMAEYASVWLGALIATNNDDLADGRALAERGIELHQGLSESIASMTEVTLVRLQLASGDWAGAFAAGSAALNERGRKGQFLPAPMIESVCVAGVYAGHAQDAEPYCRSIAGRTDSSGGVVARTFGGLIAAALGDARTAETEFAAAEALSRSNALHPRLSLFRAYAANKKSDLRAAELLIRLAIEEASEPRSSRTYRSFSAGALRLLGEWFIAADRSEEACAPLAGAVRLYGEIGADAGRAAVSALRGAASCGR